MQETETVLSVPGYLFPDRLPPLSGFLSIPLAWL